MTIIVGARIIDRVHPSRRGTVLEIDETSTEVEWWNGGAHWIQCMDSGRLATTRFGVIIEVEPGDIVQDIAATGWQSVRRVASILGGVLLQRLTECPNGARQSWSESSTREEWRNMTHDRWRIVTEIPEESGVIDIDLGDLARVVQANVVRLCEADGRTVPDIAEACWGDGTQPGKVAALATLRRALGKPGNLDKDGHPHWPTERVTRGLVSGLRLASMAVLFADSE